MICLFIEEITIVVQFLVLLRYTTTQKTNKRSFILDTNAMFCVNFYTYVDDDKIRLLLKSAAGIRRQNRLLVQLITPLALC